MKVSVELSPADTKQLQDKASRLGVSPERLAHAAISDLLARERGDFEAAAKRVLEKNRELYRRLA
jgi:predicted transcriptional regulator